MQKMWLVTRTDENGKTVTTRHKSKGKIGRKISWALTEHKAYECTGPNVTITVEKET